MADYNSAYTGAEIDQGVAAGLAAASTYAPIAHDSSATTYGKGTNSKYGHLKLSDSTSSTSGTSDGIAATPSAVKAAYDVAKGKAMVNPNILDNWYFVGGGSQQGGGQFPVNQRGATSYNEGAYSIDRWYNRQYMTASLQSSGLKLALTATGGYPFFSQRIENYQELLGKTVTISMLVSGVSSSFKGIRFSLDSSNSVGTNSTTLGNTDMDAATTPGLYTATFTVPATISHSGINAALYQGGTGRAAGDYCVISAVKVELGDTQTLAHQENSVWVLNEVPNFEEQLARCQRFAYEFNLLGSQYVYIGTGAASSTTSMQCPISLPVTMRAKPTVTSSGTFSVGGQNVTAFTLARFGGAQGTLVSTVASGLTTGAAYSLQTTAGTDSLFLSADL